MSRHGYDDDDFNIVDADGWNQYDFYAMRRAPQQPSIHMTQQMTTKVAPAYDGRTMFFAFEDAIDDWCDITELALPSSLLLSHVNLPWGNLSPLSPSMQRSAFKTEAHR